MTAGTQELQTLQLGREDVGFSPPAGFESVSGTTYLSSIVARGMLGFIWPLVSAALQIVFEDRLTCAESRDSATAIATFASSSSGIL